MIRFGGSPSPSPRCDLCADTGHYGGLFSTKNCGSVKEDWLAIGSHSAYGSTLGDAGVDIGGPQDVVAAIWQAEFACDEPATPAATADSTATISGEASGPTSRPATFPDGTPLPDRPHVGTVRNPTRRGTHARAPMASGTNKRERIT